MMDKTRSISIAILLIMLSTSLLMMAVPDEEMIVSADEAKRADTAGYSWIDSLDPSPKIQYDWIDATGGTPQKTNFKYPYTYYDCYFYQSTSPVNLPFSFPFYGNSYSNILIWPSGVLTFQDTSNGYLYYASPSGAPWPNSGYYDYYGPGNAIAPWFRYYGSVQLSGSRSNVYTTSGVTDEGLEYWVCSWENVQCYYAYNYGSGYYKITSGDNEVTYQAVLYSNGDIRFNYKDVVTTSVSLSYSGGTTSSSTPGACSRGGQYGLTGIQNEDRSIGLTYGYNSQYLKSESSILFKQFKTEIMDVQWTPGYGSELDLYPAMGGMGESDYSAKVRVWSEKGVDRLTQLDMIIGPGKEGITLRYDFTTDTFRKMNDPARMLVLREDHSSASTYKGDPDNQAVVDFRFDFNLNWQSMDHVKVRFHAYGDALKDHVRDYDNQFKVVSHVKMTGNLSAEDSRGRQLIKGDWVRGGDTLHFYGLERRYADDAITIQPPDMIRIGIKDLTGKIYTSDTTSDLDTHIYVDPVFGEMQYSLVFINVTPEADESDDTKVKVFYTNGFLVQIDSDNPGIPGRIDILPDDKNEKPRNYDNDRDVFIEWEDAIDQSSGVVKYYYSVNKPKDRATDPVSMPKAAGSNVAEIKNLPQGVNKIYLWAEDLVGNQGNEIFVEVTIDLEGVTFGGFYPTIDVWNTQIRPTCSIFINDTLTGVDPLSIEYEIATSSVGFSENWQNIQDSYASAESLRVVVTGFFKNGKENWIRFRAQDLAGNKYQVSDGYNVWVDAEEPDFDLLSHSEDTYHLTPSQEVRIMITDKESGVDASSIEYRVTTQGMTDWSPWRTYKEGIDGRNVEVSLNQVFRRGDRNYIQVRARDLAGNPVSTSDPFNIRINTFPVAVVSSPSSGDIFYDDTDIVFDASSSFDPDEDKLSFEWYYSVGDEQTKLAEVSRYITPLEIGEYTITLVIKDRMDNEVQKNFVLTVEKRPSADNGGIVVDPSIDTDADGVNDWFELMYKLDPLVKDSGEDPDNDGYTNAQEFGNGRWFAQNLTNPKDRRSHPTDLYRQPEEEDDGPFSQAMLPLWGILVLLTIVVIITMGVLKNKKDKQIKRIRSIRNMRKIMPSVSWDQITTTAYMAPYVQGAALQAPSGPALPTAAPAETESKSALPPAQEQEEDKPTVPSVISSMILVAGFVFMNMIISFGGIQIDPGNGLTDPGSSPFSNQNSNYHLNYQCCPNDLDLSYIVDHVPEADREIESMEMEDIPILIVSFLGTVSAGSCAMYIFGKRKGVDPDKRSKDNLKRWLQDTSEYEEVCILDEISRAAMEGSFGDIQDKALKNLDERFKIGDIDQEKYWELKKALDRYRR